MNTMAMTLLAVPVVASGYAVLSLAALIGATVLAWDGGHLFLGGDRSQKVLHQRRYVSSMTDAISSLVGVLVVLVVIGVALASAAALVVSLL
jgi:hypothetical protein